MQPIDPSTCPEPETLAALVDGTGLSLEERNRVIAHLATCPACVAWLTSTVGTVRALAQYLPTEGDSSR